ncbi:1,4-dihydroxy-2-naphthoate octaprenyltransferase [Desulfatibacillum aliphaticivorans]|uniref:1,4-dihydroxy-2-naphthoate octaprenyltransferase n=2 Tax=Desulfatibacillum aliphaticivorans TaxID=218208 RepID=B8FCL3_DESAL|nr:1,4-dihydroxy-2-naphthoate octaprenyltransferase [Desulfatibacillum aliphaticivorans]
MKKYYIMGMNTMKTWFLATRPWSFAMSLISVGVGAAWAGDYGVSWFWLILTAIALVCIHGAANLTNDYFDYKNKVDVPDAPTTKYRPHPLAQNLLTLHEVKWFALTLFAVGIVLGLVMAAAKGWPLILVGAAGIFIAVAYTAPPIALKYHALGEPMVFLCWGPLAIQGAYFVQTGAFSLPLLLVSAPFGALVSLVLLANNLRDAEFDRRQGISTIPVRFGGRSGRLLFAGLIALSFGGVAVMAIFGPLPIWSLAVLLALPLAWPMFKMVSQDIPDDADAQTARLDTVFGVLLLASLVLEHVL